MSPLAIISGATGGIGTAIATTLWFAGYSLVCLGRSDVKLGGLRDALTAAPFPGQHMECLYHNLDDQGHTQVVERAITRYPGPPTLLVCAHGAEVRTGTEDLDARMQRTFATDVLGTYQLCTTVANRMRAWKQGSIVVISSLHSKATYPNRSHYATAKAALGGMVRALALDYGQDNVRINAICAWQVDGPRTAQVARSEGEDTLGRYREKSPLRRLVDPQDVARTVLWLTECQSMTGAEILLDCGVSASMWHRPFTEG